MKTRLFAFAVIASVLLNIVVFSAFDTKTQKAAKRLQASRLVSLLPPSDGIAIFDARRFLNDALPKVLSSNQRMLAEIMAKLNEAENSTGIDLRKFDQIAVGVTIKSISPKEVDFDPVAIASGDINAGALIAVAKLASNGTYREEKINGRTVYVFTAKSVMQKTSAPANSKIAGVVDKAIKGLTSEVAVTSLDNNTLVLGSLERVRQALDGRARVDQELVNMLSRSETAVMSFAAKTPNGTSKFLPLDNDELGKNVDAIRYLSGSVDVTGAGTSVQMTARTLETEQAKGLKTTIEGLQMVGTAIFGGSKRADQQIYGRMIKNAKVALRGNEVTLDLLIPQADIDSLIGGLK